MAPYVCRATQTYPRWNLIRRCNTVAVDVEFQRVLYPGAAKWTQRIGRIALVDENLNTLYDVYAAYRREAGARKEMNPKRFGVIWNDLKSKNGAVPAAIVKWNCRRIFKGRTVVMHAAQGDMNSFRIEQDAFVDSTIVDTQSLYHGPMGLRHPPRLADCSADYLGQSIQTGTEVIMRNEPDSSSSAPRHMKPVLELDASEHIRRDAITLTYSNILARDMAIARIVLRVQITIDEARRREALEVTPTNDEVKSTGIVDLMISATEDYRTDGIERLEDFDGVDSDEHMFYS